MNQFALYGSFGGSLIADYSHKVQDLRVASGPRGFAEASCFIPMPLAEAFQLYDRAGLPSVRFTDSATGAIYEGRLEDVNIVSNGVKVKAFGYARAFSDLPYTAMWSVSNLDTFLAHWSVTGAGLFFVSQRKFDVKIDGGKITVGLVKNSIIAATERGGGYYKVPDLSATNVTGITCYYEFLASANTTLRVSAYDSSYNFAADIVSVLGTGALIKGAVFIGTNAPIVTFDLEGTTNQNYVGETGAEYATFSFIHLVGDTTTLVNTTLTAARTNGAGVTCTVGSTANMYVGQRLYLAGGGSGESLTVTSITDATHFVATVVNAPGGGYPIGTVVGALIVYANQIVSGMLSTVRATNSGQLAASTALIQSPGIDLLDEVYEDRAMDDILDELTGLGDTQTPPRQWEWGVYDGQQLFFRPQSSASRTWYIDLAEIDVDRTLDQLHNSVYAVYQDASSLTLRSAANTDATSVTRYGLTRQEALDVQTTSTTIANVHRDAALADGKDLPPRAAISLDRVYDATGARWPLASVRAGDTVTIRNLPPTLSTTIDRIRIFRLTRAEYHADDDTLQVEPETPLPTLDALLARLAIGTKP